MAIHQFAASVAILPGCFKSATPQTDFENRFDEEGIVRKIWLSLFLSGMCAVLGLSGCAKKEISSVVAPSPAASRAAKPTPRPVQGDLDIATDKLELAIKEFHNRNNRGALEFIELARVEITAAVANAPDKSKSKFEAVAKDFDLFKTKVEQNDKKTDDSFEKLMKKIEKLAESK